MPPNDRRRTVYDCGCPTRHVLDRIADTWTALIVGLLAPGPQRFTALQRQLPGISQKMLSQTLRGLERDGLVDRTVYPDVPPRVEYALTPLGQTLREPLAAIRRWSEEHIDAIMQAQASYDQARDAQRGPSDGAPPPA